MSGIHMHMHPTILATFFAISRTVVSMCSAGILVCLIALWAEKAERAKTQVKGLTTGFTG
jgi:hypothetical protein